MNTIQLTCRVVAPCGCVRTKNGKVETRSLRAGETVSGFEDFQGGNGANYTPVLKTVDGWRVPTKCLTVIKEEEIQEAIVLEDDYYLNEDTKKKVKEVAENATKSVTAIIDKQRKMSENAIKLSFVGGGIGLGYSIVKKKSVFAGLLMGLLIGGIVGQGFDTYWRNRK